MIRVAAAIFLSLVAQAPAMACRCRAPNLVQAFAHANAVVIGNITTVRDLDQMRTVFTVAVDRSWKHPEAGTVEVDTGTTCRLAIRQGQRYLLFLRRDAAGRYFTTHCMGDLVDPTDAEVDAVSRLAPASSH